MSFPPPTQDRWVQPGSRNLCTLRYKTQMTAASPITTFMRGAAKALLHAQKNLPDFPKPYLQNRLDDQVAFCARTKVSEAQKAPLAESWRFLRKGSRQTSCYEARCEISSASASAFSLGLLALRMTKHRRPDRQSTCPNDPKHPSFDKTRGLGKCAQEHPRSLSPW